MRLRRHLALVLLLSAAGLVTGLAFALRGGSEPVEVAVAAGPGSTEAATTEEARSVAAAPDVPGETGPVPPVYAEGAREVPFDPRLRARAYIAIDAETGEVLIARHDRQRRPIASLTKMMTALLVIERGTLGTLARVPAEATRVEPSREGLVAGKSYPRKLLLYSSLLVSANDSAVTLAYDAGAGSLPRFFRAMNARARELGMTDTLYRSVSGLNDETNLSSARDQAILARAALGDPVFARIVATRRRRVEWPAPTYAKLWVNHNRMLFTYPGTYGVKTGWTTTAGGCLVVAARRDGHDVIGVVLASGNIWADMPRLLDAAFARAAA